MDENNRLGGKIEMYVMNPENSFEIDSEFDFKLIERIKDEKNKHFNLA